MTAVLQQLLRVVRQFSSSRAARCIRSAAGSKTEPQVSGRSASRAYAAGKAKSGEPLDLLALALTDRPLPSMKDGYVCVSEKPAYSRYLSVYDRTIRFPDGRELKFDVVGHPRNAWGLNGDGHSCVVFVYHSATQEVTCVREYAQGPNGLILGFAAGGYDPKTHESLEACARAELSEEVRLKGGELIRLLPADHPGVLEVKWCRNRFTPFLCIDPVADVDPGERDVEEEIEILRMPLEQFRREALSGSMMQSAMTTTTLALEVLRSRGLLMGMS